MLPNDCVDWLTTLGQVDRAGDDYRCDPTNYSAIRRVQCYRLFRLSYIDTFLDSVVQKLPIRNVYVAGRLKRLPTIVRKLSRQPNMHLSQMADILGMRVICGSFAQAEEIARSLSSSPWFKRERSYWDNARDTGYRACHLLMHAKQELPSKKGALTVHFEVQVRSYYQHLWGLVSESYGEQVKEGGGPSAIRNYLESLSHSIAAWEKQNPTVVQQEMPAVADERKLLVVRVRSDSKPQAFVFDRDMKGAINQLLRWEESLDGGGYETLMLAGVGDVRNLNATHASFLGAKNYHLPDWMPQLPTFA